jgi:hypothetical protein
MFTPQRTPSSINLSINVKIEDAGGVPGSMRRLILSLQVVIDQTIKQLSLYFLCSSKSLDIMVDFVKI